MGIPERRKREKEHRRNAIIDAAERVFFSKGVDVATMDDVAEEAELSKGTLYLYFKSKEDLYLAITKRGLEILTNMFEKAIKKFKLGIDKIQAIGKAYCEFSKKHPDYFHALIFFDSQIKDFTDEHPNAKDCEEQGEKALGVCADALKHGIEDGSIRSEINPKKAAVILWGQSTGILQLISTKGEHMTNKFGQLGFKTTDEIIEYSFELIRYSLEKSTKGDRI